MTLLVMGLTVGLGLTPVLVLALLAVGPFHYMRGRGLPAWLK
jgi:hypothetical protein